MPPLSGSNPSGVRTSRSSSGAESTGTRSSSSSADDLPCVKCVLVGDGAVGKTSLVVGYSKSEHPSANYIPTAFDNYSVIVNIDGRPIKLNMCDTAGQDELDSLRALCYSEADVFLVCFSIVCQSSFENVTAKWLPEILNHRSSTNNKESAAPILLIGTQSDLRRHPSTLEHLERYGEGPVPHAAAAALAARLEAPYLECSAVTGEGVKDVFDAAIFTALDRRGLVRRCRRGLVGSIRRRKKGGKGRYRCASKLWERAGDEAESAVTAANDDKSRARWKLFSCFSK